MHYVYVLKSEKDENLYIGVTSNLKRRFKEHNEGLNKSTMYRIPFTLIYYEAYRVKDDAYNRESKLKNYKNSYTALKRRIESSLDVSA